MGNSLIDSVWYDPVGRLVMTNPSGSALVQKSLYDNAGRITTQYSTITSSSSSSFPYPYPISVSSDTVFQQIENTYDAASNLTQAITRQRMHNASGSGGLVNPTTSPTGRVYYLALYQDPLGRLIYKADYGTNGASGGLEPTRHRARQFSNHPCHGDCL